MTRAASAARLTWILLAVAALAFHVYAVLFTNAGDSHIVFGWAMMVLTFPLGLLPLFAFGLISQISDGVATNALGFAGIASLWLTMTTIGFLQWFWLIPKATHWIRRIGGSAGKR